MKSFLDIKNELNSIEMNGKQRSYIRLFLGLLFKHSNMDIQYFVIFMN